jgi:hypothetical protein
VSAVAYSTREAVKAALDSKLTARDDVNVDEALLTATDSIYQLTHRRFYPELATRSFDWPQRSSRPWRLWLGENELISATTVTSGGVVIPAGANGYLLRNFGDDATPPFTHVEISRSGNAAFGGGDTPQRDITIVGLYGHSNTEKPASALENAVASTSTTTVDVTNSALIGVGQLIRIDDERMIVTGKTMVDTGQGFGDSMTASVADTAIGVADGTAYAVGEVILRDSERMLIVDISSNTLTVKRAWDGTVLAAHTDSAIFAPRRLTVERGALGTTAATHADATAIVKHQAPPIIRQLARAEALVELAQMSEAYARLVGSAENARESSGRGIVELRRRARVYARQARTMAI